MRQVKSLRDKVGAKFYFLVRPGGYGEILPDKEYVEFPDEGSVVEYVRDVVRKDDVGRKPGESAGLAEGMTFEDARKTLLEIGEFGSLKSPLMHDDALVGSKNARAPRDLEDLQTQLTRVVTDGRMEIIDGVEIDTEKAALLLKFLSIINPAFAAAATAMGVASLLHQAYKWFTGAKEASSDGYEDFDSVKLELQQRIARVDPSIDLPPSVLRVFQAMSVEVREAALCNPMSVILREAQRLHKEWQLEGEGKDLETFLTDRESAFFKIVKPPAIVEEEKAKVAKKVSDSFVAEYRDIISRYDEMFSTLCDLEERLSKKECNLWEGLSKESREEVGDPKKYRTKLNAMQQWWSSHRPVGKASYPVTLPKDRKRAAKMIEAEIEVMDRVLKYGENKVKELEEDMMPEVKETPESENSPVTFTET